MRGRLKAEGRTGVDPHRKGSQPYRCQEARHGHLAEAEQKADQPRCCFEEPGGTEHRRRGWLRATASSRADDPLSISIRQPVPKDG